MPFKGIVNHEENWKIHKNHDDENHHQVEVEGNGKR